MTKLGWVSCKTVLCMTTTEESEVPYTLERAKTEVL